MQTSRQTPLLETTIPFPLSTPSSSQSFTLRASITVACKKARSYVEEREESRRSTPRRLKQASSSLFVGPQVLKRQHAASTRRRSMRLQPAALLVLLLGDLNLLET